VTGTTERENERLQVLRLIQDGRVTPEQGAELLRALEAPDARTGSGAQRGVKRQSGDEAHASNGNATRDDLDYMDDRPARGAWSGGGPYVVAAHSAVDGPQWLRLRVTDRQGRTSTDVQLPLSIVTAGLQIGSRWLPQLRFLDPAMVLGLLRVRTGHPVFVAQDGPGGDRIEITVE
jgi:hypothetical protein